MPDRDEQQIHIAVATLRHKATNHPAISIMITDADGDTIQIASDRPDEIDELVKYFTKIAKEFRAQVDEFNNTTKPQE